MLAASRGARGLLCFAVSVTINCLSKLQLVRHHLRPRAPCTERMLLDLAFPDLGHAEGVERVLVLTADGDSGDATAIRDGEDDLGGAVVGADLDAALRGDELTAFLRVAEALRARVVVPILDVEVEEAFFVYQRAVVGGLITVGPLRVTFADGEEPLIGKKSHAGGEVDACIDLLLLAFLDEPHAETMACIQWSA